MAYSRLLSIVLFGLFSVSACSQQQLVDPKSALVHQFIAAFNAQDAFEMGKMVTEDIKWFSISDGTTSIDAEGRSNLVAAMESYFDSCPTCRSKISAIMPSQDRVTAIEVASWEVNGELRSQQSVSVYEFSGIEIAAVYYFPTESVSDDFGG